MVFNKLLESSYLARYFLLNSVDISDYKIFPVRHIQNSPPVFYFSAHDNKEALVDNLNLVASTNFPQFRTATLDQLLESNGTVAFLVLKGTQLLVERYYHGYEHSSVCTSFSIAKSFVSAMVGIALHEKLINGLDDSITEYLPELKAGYWSPITLRHLISMSSGLRYNANGFFPWSEDPRTYYSLNLRKLALQAKKEQEPGINFHYNNYNLILLGMILERVTGGAVSDYLQDKIWKHLGMEYPATWSLDSRRSGMEKMESGLNARAIDFAKFGCLYLNRGVWNGKQIVPESWVVESTTISADDRWTNYKYLWWTIRSGKGRFMAVGNLGQFIFIAPDKDCVILRFGKGKPKGWQQVYVKLFNSLVESL